ncbi:MAG: acyltransferase [Acidobacteriota bacterium]
MSVFKKLIFAMAVLVQFVPAALSAFGRISGVFTFFAHANASFPGLPGDYFRAAYYWMTLRDCAPDARISFGTFFAHPDATVGRHTYIGAYCILGRVRIGSHVMLASHVQVLSGNRQHERDDSGTLSSSDVQTFKEISIGDHSWIGAGAIVMNSVGDHATVGAASIVTAPVAASTVVVGNPARPLRPAASPKPI